MKSKAIIALFIAALSTSLILPAEGNTPQKSLVIIDTGFDTALPVISEAVIFEVCILSYSLCPNGRTFQEGPGAATLPASAISSGNMSHGTQMASIAMNTNPGQ